MTLKLPLRVEECGCCIHDADGLFISVVEDDKPLREIVHRVNTWDAMRDVLAKFIVWADAHPRKCTFSGTEEARAALRNADGKPCNTRT